MAARTRKSVWVFNQASATLATTDTAVARISHAQQNDAARRRADSSCAVGAVVPTWRGGEVSSGDVLPLWLGELAGADTAAGRAVAVGGAAVGR
ncbi:hypothetical protein [Mycobacterium avium]|uniref:hypothetical protein n=1 Tax=Mycobacterium avium TaxID=1764 RepID=UPI0013EA2447|nr:hypothetical protein [Mycobacterium avium]